MLDITWSAVKAGLDRLSPLSSCHQITSVFSNDGRRIIDL